jgi:6-pyruvoyltetrahydropterin/6-carboxytetrahydropterin synthase
MILKRKLQVKSHFDSAHFLRNYQGKCARIHGHRWDVVFVFQGKAEPDELGMLVDFGDLRKIIDANLPDHTFLNDLPEYKEINPTAENICEHLFYQFRDLFFEKFQNRIMLTKVEIYESPNCSASVEV